MPARELEVPATAAGTRLDAWLAEVLGVSRAAAAALVDSGAVLVGGARRSKGTRLRGGEGVRIEEAAPEPVPEPPAEPAIVWEGESFVVVDKPAGIVVHPAPGHRGVTLVEWLARRSPGWDPHAVHRLDRDTSGLMLVAKGEPAQRELQAALRRREVVREYLALATGRLAVADGHDRRAARARRAPSHAHVHAHGPAARGAHALRGRAVRRPPHPRPRAA